MEFSAIFGFSICSTNEKKPVLFGLLRTRQRPFAEARFEKKALPQNAKPSKLLCLPSNVVVGGALCVLCGKKTVLICLSCDSSGVAQAKSEALNRFWFRAKPGPLFSVSSNLFPYLIKILKVVKMFIVLLISRKDYGAACRVRLPG
jgi:hypothetical protein